MGFIKQLKSYDVWQQMRHISLEDMNSVRLMNRIDTKYVTHQRNLLPILQRAAEKNYNVFCETTVLNHYLSTYYDTPSLVMYTMHHNRRLHRQKIRCRTYVDTDVSFLEIKDKNNKGRTKKVRMPISCCSIENLRQKSEVADFISTHSPFVFSELIPALQTDFYRITLVNEEKTERITIDIHLTFNNCINGTDGALDDVIIIELKQDGRYVSTMRNILRELRIKPFRLSKYCIGIAITTPQVKANRFKYKLHLIDKLKKYNERYFIV